MTDERIMELIGQLPPEAQPAASIFAAFAKVLIDEPQAWPALRDMHTLARGIATGLYTLNEDEDGKFSLTYNDPFDGLVPVETDYPGGHDVW